MDLLELKSVVKQVTVNTLHKIDEQSVNVVEVNLKAVDTQFTETITSYSNEIFNLGKDIVEKRVPTSERSKVGLYQLRKG